MNIGLNFYEHVHTLIGISDLIFLGNKIEVINTKNLKRRPLNLRNYD